jgi:hypothetical protein
MPRSTGVRAGVTDACPGQQVGGDLLVAEVVVAAVEQTEEQVGPDLCRTARMAGALHRRRQALEPFAGRGGLVGGQAGGGDRDGAGDVEITDHLPLPDGPVVAAAGMVGVDGDDRAQQPGCQLPGGPPRGGLNQASTDRGDLVGREPADARVQMIREHRRLGPVETPGQQRLEHQR